MSSYFARYIHSKQNEILLIIILTIISAFTHGYNMFNFPYYENDEGVYMSQAWSLATQGKLAPYTYWYDHAPWGWIQIAVWIKLTGGVFAFGNSINSGRAFMLVTHLVTTVLLYLVTKNVTHRRRYAITAVILWILSPLGIYFQRRVLLDNIMIMWVLATVYTLQRYTLSIWPILFSAFFAAGAILSKETAVFFIPVFLYMIWSQVHKLHKHLSLALWGVILLCTIGLYITYASVKGELFPPNFLWMQNQEHVSLVNTLFYQTNRPGGSIFDIENSEFWKSFFKIWVTEDPILLWLGIGATGVNILHAIYRKEARYIAALSIVMWIFLMRGGFVIEFYIIPLLPILALNIAYAVSVLDESLKHINPSRVFALTAFAIPVLLITLATSQHLDRSPKVRGGNNIYTTEQTKSQLLAIDWIKKYRKPTDNIIIDNFAYIDLRKDPQKSFNNSEWFIKVDTDRDIREKKLNGDYRHIDYLMVTPQVETDVPTMGLTIMDQAIKNSKLITNFDYNFWRVKIYGVMTPHRIANASYEWRIRDENSNANINQQIDTLMQSTIQNDEETFSKTFQNIKITKANIPLTITEHLEMTHAMIRASQLWNKEQHNQEANTLINYAKENFIENWNGYSIPRPITKTATSITLSLNSLTIDALEAISNFTDDSSWQNIKSSYYQLLEQCTEGTVLPATTCTGVQNTRTRAITFTPGNDYTLQSYRVILNLVRDLKWYKDSRAQTILKKFTHYETEWETRYQLAATYTTAGVPVEDYETARSYATAVLALTTQNKDKAKEVWDLKIRDRFMENESQSYWENPQDHEAQILSWYATKFMDQSIK